MEGTAAEGEYEATGPIRRAHWFVLDRLVEPGERLFRGAVGQVWGGITGGFNEATTLKLYTKAWYTITQGYERGSACTCKASRRSQRGSPRT